MAETGIIHQPATTIKIPNPVQETALAKIETPGPGIYQGVPFETYLAWQAISNSSMQAALKSMAHYKCQKPIEPTRQMIVGTLTHSARFEEGSVNNRFAFQPDFKDKANEIRVANKKEKSDAVWATNEYKKLVNDFKVKAVADGKEVITEEEFTNLIGMVRALSADKTAKSYLSGGLYEVSIVAKDPETGLLCKARIDHMHAAASMITDLKSTADASEFEKSIANYHYHRQLALYGDMLGWLPQPITIEQRNIVAVESSSPYCVRSAPVSEDDIDEGRDEYRRLLNQIAECHKTKKWPGYENPKTWTRPHWAKRKDTAEPVTLKVGGNAIAM
jgi:PDDEXK-like domain of unknown function (DUF3799)